MSLLAQVTKKGLSQEHRFLRFRTCRGTFLICKRKQKPSTTCRCCENLGGMKYCIDYDTARRYPYTLTVRCGLSVRRNGCCEAIYRWQISLYTWRNITILPSLSTRTLMVTSLRRQSPGQPPAKTVTMT